MPPGPAARAHLLPGLAAPGRPPPGRPDPSAASRLAGTPRTPHLRARAPPRPAGAPRGAAAPGSPDSGFPFGRASGRVPLPAGSFLREPRSWTRRGTLCTEPGGWTLWRSSGRQALRAAARQTLAAPRPGARSRAAGMLLPHPSCRDSPGGWECFPTPEFGLRPALHSREPEWGGGAGVQCSWWELCGGQKGVHAWSRWRGLQQPSVTSGVRGQWVHGTNLRLRRYWHSHTTM